MPLTAFVDENVIQELRKNNNIEEKEDMFPEYEFLASCLRIGLKMEDLKILTYIDVFKIFICFCRNESSNERKATQEEIDNLVMKM